MTNTLYLPELREMLTEHNVEEMKEFSVALHPARTAEFMEGLTPAESWAILQHADPSTRGQIFGYFDRDKQVEIIESGDRAEIGQLIAELPADDRVDILKAVPSEVVDQLLPYVPALDRRDILRLRSYPEGTAGAMMTTQFARLPEGLTVKQALDEVAKQSEELETIYYVYIVDDDDHLRGLVSARQLVSALGKPNMKIDELMDHELVSVDVKDDQEQVAQKVARFDLHAIPVVDEEHHMLGIITHDDVMDVLREEATEDVHMQGAVAPGVENYMEASFTTVWRKRAVWLSCLFVAEILTFQATTHFKPIGDAFEILLYFIPLCISTGGNSGSQAATLITRSMALGQVTLGDWWRVIWHELAMGLALGCTLGVIGFLRAFSTPKIDLGRAPRFELAFVVAQSVALICIWGTLVGSMLPLIFKRLGFDPGYASSPFVATFVDVTGIIIFFSIAQLWLPIPAA
ncbi:MAG TPA: magnesium transporter [Pirellulales bacterium]|nr:magnesium transporter [Pirellulales bacterium]